MKLVKIVLIAALAYVALVFTFESLLGYFQPQAGSVLVITTVDEDGQAHDRVVSRLESRGQLYVAANHWPRAWYGNALANPEVTVTFEDESAPYTAVPTTGDETERVEADNPLGLGFRFLTGFPPRYFLRLDPR